MTTKLYLLRDEARELEAMMYAYSRAFTEYELDYDERCKANDMFNALFKKTIAIVNELESMEEESESTKDGEPEGEAKPIWKPVYTGELKTDKVDISTATE